MEYWRRVKDGVEVVDSMTDYSENDWTVDVNCFKFQEHVYFDEQMQAINRSLILQRNKLDSGIVEPRRHFWWALWTTYTTVNEAL